MKIIKLLSITPDALFERILQNALNKSQIQDKVKYVISYGHIKAFLAAYFSHLALNDINLSVAFYKRSKVPKAMLKGKINIEHFEHEEIIHKPRGVVFHGKG